MCRQRKDWPSKTRKMLHGICCLVLSDIEAFELFSRGNVIGWLGFGGGADPPITSRRLGGERCVA